MKYKITYYNREKEQETKIEDTELTKEELLQHMHVISVEEIVAKAASPEEKPDSGDKKTKGKTRKR